MITFKEYLAEIAIKGKAVKSKKKVTEVELRELVKNRDVEGLENADVSGITDMSSLFKETNIGSPEFNPDLSDWDTSKVTDMYAMFRSCASLEKAPNFNTSKVTDMAFMFGGCSNLKEAPNFNTSKVTDMFRMFLGCTSLKEAPNFNTSNVENMRYMFGDCTSLTKGDISNWDVSKVEHKAGMFENCPFPEDKKPKFKD